MALSEVWRLPCRRAACSYQMMPKGSSLLALASARLGAGIVRPSAAAGLAVVLSSFWVHLAVLAIEARMVAGGQQLPSRPC